MIYLIAEVKMLEMLWVPNFPFTLPHMQFQQIMMAHDL